jgi:hypothetical protein
MSQNMSDPTTPHAPETVSPSPTPPEPIDPRTELTLAEQVTHYVDMWKKSVDVQQHFNDIEWRIRGLALTVATFAIGAAGVAAKDGTRVGWFSLGALVVVVGLILWYAFYFVDRVWYHPLLKAAVEQGTIIENEIKKHLPKAGLTHNITIRSRQNTGKVVRFFSRKSIMRSEDKLVWFYTVGAAAFVVSAIALQAGAMLNDDGSQKPRRMDVRIIQSEPSSPKTSATAVAPTATPGKTPAAPAAPAATPWPSSVPSPSAGRSS